MDKRSLTERDICTKFILPAVKRAGWDEMVQVREEVHFTKGRIIVRGKLVTRGRAKKADIVLYYKPNIPIALIKAKDNKHSVRPFHLHPRPRPPSVSVFTGRTDIKSFCAYETQCVENSNGQLVQRVVKNKDL